MLVLLAAQSSSAYVRLLPGGATVVEVALLPPAIHRGRLLVLWMASATPVECQEGWEETWTTMCPDSTRGCSAAGPTRVSLVDTEENRLINTLRITNPVTRADSFDVPRRLGPGGPYRVEVPFGRPNLLWLRDYTGQGEASQFALFDAATCSMLFTTLLGYDSEHDRLVQYSIHSWWRDRSGRWHSYSSPWELGLFAVPPVRPGYWRYRGGGPGAPHSEYEVRYRADTRSFEAWVLQSETQ
jgi:hypothetical protein